MRDTGLVRGVSVHTPGGPLTFWFATNAPPSVHRDTFVPENERTWVTVKFVFGVKANASVKLPVALSDAGGLTRIVLVPKLTPVHPLKVTGPGKFCTVRPSSSWAVTVTPNGRPSHCGEGIAPQVKWSTPRVVNRHMALPAKPPRRETTFQ